MTLTFNTIKYTLAAVAMMVVAMMVSAQVTAQTGHPDFADIKRRSTDPQSQYYYPRLLKSFLSNDTVMTDADYRYFYYGTMFQEDYDPYRPYPFAEELKSVEPLYFKVEHLTKGEKERILALADKSINNNPVDLTQIMYKVYINEKKGKIGLASIWKHKLDRLLLTIANSGDGTTPETAWVIVYPKHEFDFFNISGGSVTGRRFQQPYYERLTVLNKKGDKTTEHYFDLHHLLEQYYLKHPEEN